MEPIFLLAFFTYFGLFFCGRRFRNNWSKFSATITRTTITTTIAIITITTAAIIITSKFQQGQRFRTIIHRINNSLESQPSSSQSTSHYHSLTTVATTITTSVTIIVTIATKRL